MTDYPTKRVRYYDGQFLLSSDFIDEQSYHEDQLALHQRTQHFWGIAEGLEVTASTTATQSVDVAPGVALDRQGNQILLAVTAQQSFANVGPGTRYLVIQFGEVQSDPAAAKYIPGNTRWSQVPGLAVKPSLSTGDVVLATLTLTGATGEDIRQWLTEARGGARARPIEATLARSGDGYSGTLIVAIGSSQ